MTDVLKLSITNAHEAMKRGDFSATELLESCLLNIKEKDGEIHAFLEVFEDSAREEAKHAEKLFKDGKATLLTGIPISVKDNILIKGHIASAASKILQNYKATYDATVISKLKKEGVVFIGRTNLYEFAMGASTENSAYGPTKNPHDTTRVPGGSSGGSAASVASGMCLASLGSDTAGSIRQPSSFCGVVGLKPTYGSVSRNGLIALGSSLDCIGPIAKSPEDVKIIYEAIKGKDALDATSVDEGLYKGDAKVKTIGVPRDFLNSGHLDKETLENFASAEEDLKKAGFEIKDISLPSAKYAVPAYYIILPAEASANLARFDGVRYGFLSEGEKLLDDYKKTRGQGFGKEVRRRILIGTYVLSAGYYDAYYNKATAVRGLIAKDYAKAFKNVDAIMTPTTAGPAFKIGEKSNDPIKMYLEDIFTVPANHAGLPAINVPYGWQEMDGGKKLPLGIHFVAPKMCEGRLFTLAEVF